MSLHESCEAFRDLVKQLFFSKASGISDKDAIVGDSSKALKYLLQIKEDVRKAAISTEQLKDQTAEGQTDLDDLNLQLQNLLYEKQYYEKEIRMCQHFVSAFSDQQIGLVTLEEFQLLSPSDTVNSSAHLLTLKRLLGELTDRKSLLARRDDLKIQRDELQKQLRTARSSVDNVSRLLRALDSASEPLQTLLSPQVKLSNLRKVSEHLPLPLYVIYSQLAASSETSSFNVSVDILGSVSEAQQFNAAFSSSPRDSSGKAPAAKRSKKDPSQSPPAAAEMGQAHPLWVTLSVQDPAAPPSVSVEIRFQYLPHLRLVTASCFSDPLLLPNLFPGDAGDLEMVEMLSQRAASTGAAPTLPAGARPYRWAQQLGGMDFISTLPYSSILGEEERSVVLAGFAEYRGQQRVATLLTLLLHRKASLMALNSHLTKPKNKPLRALATPPKFVVPNLPRAMLMSWSEVKIDGDSAKGNGITVRGDGRASASGMEGKGWSSLDVRRPPSTDTAADVVEVAYASPSARLFAVEFKAQLPGVAQVLVFDVQLKVFMEYPTRPPAIRVLGVRELASEGKGSGRNITNACTNDLQWIESQVNDKVLSRVPPESADDTLMYQMMQLRLCMDDVARRLAAESQNSDMLSKLTTRQLLSGRDRCGNIAELG